MNVDAIKTILTDAEVVRGKDGKVWIQVPDSQLGSRILCTMFASPFQFEIAEEVARRINRDERRASTEQLIAKAKRLSIAWATPGMKTDTTEFSSLIEDVHRAVCAVYGVDYVRGFQMTTEPQNS